MFGAASSFLARQSGGIEGQTRSARCMRLILPRQFEIAAGSRIIKRPLVSKQAQFHSMEEPCMSNPSLFCDECKRPLRAPSPSWAAPSNAVALCGKCNQVSGPAPGSGLIACVLEVEPDSGDGAAAFGG